VTTFVAQNGWQQFMKDWDAIIVIEVSEALIRQAGELAGSTYYADTMQSTWLRPFSGNKRQVNLWLSQLLTGSYGEQGNKKA
jgi:hypothetical protein